MKVVLVAIALPILVGLAIALPAAALATSPTVAPITWPAGLPVYDHVVIVVEENKDYKQIVGSPNAPFLNRLRGEGANFTGMFGEEHHSQGNYFCLFSGNNQGVGFRDGVPHDRFEASNLGRSLIQEGFSFKGYAEDLPAIGSTAVYGPAGAEDSARVYARKHVPWVSLKNVPNGRTPADSSNLRFKEFPKDPAGFAALPTVAFVVPNLKNDVHDTEPSLTGDKVVQASIRRGDKWVEDNLGAYYTWAKTHNSLLIVTFDESFDGTGEMGLTDPFVAADTEKGQDIQNHIFTVFAGAHIKPGDYAEGKGVTHVNILRTLEAMYGLPRSGAQQPNALRGGIADDYLITDVFEEAR